MRRIENRRGYGGYRVGKPQPWYAPAITKIMRREPSPRIQLRSELMFLFYLPSICAISKWCANAGVVLPAQVFKSGLSPRLA